MNNKTKQGGLGIVSVLTIIFVVLKLLGVIKWSWIWVLSPLWISAVIVLAVFSVILIGGRIKKGKWQLPTSKAEQLSTHLFSILKAGAFLFPERRHFQRMSKAV